MWGRDRGGECVGERGEVRVWRDGVGVVSVKEREWGEVSVKG